MVEPVGVGLSAAKFLTSFRVGYWTKRHNRVVEREYEDRVRWVRDESRAEDKALGELAIEMNDANLFYSGTHDNKQKEIHDVYAQHWRDRKSAGDRLIQDARDEETPMHAWWRKIRGRPWPENVYTDEIAQTARGWEP